MLDSPPEIRTGQGSLHLWREEFALAFRARFADPAYSTQQDLFDQLEETAWGGYRAARKSPSPTRRVRIWWTPTMIYQLIS